MLFRSGVNAYASWVRDDARQFATAHSGVDIHGKDDKFFVNLGNYISVDDYNNQKLIQRQAEKMYLPSEKYFWQWDSNKNRSQYRSMRIQSDVAFNELKYVGVLVGVNHLASAINAAISASSHNKNLQSLEFHILPERYASGKIGSHFEISIKTPF